MSNQTISISLQELINLHLQIQKLQMEIDTLKQPAKPEPPKPEPPKPVPAPVLVAKPVVSSAPKIRKPIRHHLTETEKKLILEMWAEGKTMATISKKFDRTPQTIYNLIQKTKKQSAPEQDVLVFE